MAKFFIEQDTLVCNAYGIESPKQFMNTLYYNIKTIHAMDTIIIDCDKHEISKKLLVFSGAYSLNNSSKNPIIRTKTKLNSTKVLSRGTLIP